MAQALLTLMLTSVLMLGSALGIDLGQSPTKEDLAQAVEAVRAAANPGSGELVEPQRKTLAPGKSYETTYYVLDSGKPGPTVMIVGGLHGGEPAVYQAGKELLEKGKHITRGKVVLLPEAHTLAIARGVRYLQSDLNREFPTSASGAAKSNTAGAIWDLVKSVKPDWLIDLHDEESSSYGQFVLYNRSQSPAGQVAKGLADELNRNVPNSSARFSALSNPVSGSIARAAADWANVQTLLLETRHMYPLELRKTHLVTGVEWVLTYLGMI